jgi:hypothetical protein
VVRVPHAKGEIEVLDLPLQEDMEVLPVKGAVFADHFQHSLQHGACYKKDTVYHMRWR